MEFSEVKTYLNRRDEALSRYPEQRSAVKSSTEKSIESLAKTIKSSATKKKKIDSTGEVADVSVVHDPSWDGYVKKFENLKKKLYKSLNLQLASNEDTGAFQEKLVHQLGLSHRALREIARNTSGVKLALTDGLDRLSSDIFDALRPLAWLDTGIGQIVRSSRESELRAIDGEKLEIAMLDEMRSLNTLSKKDHKIGLASAREKRMEAVRLARSNRDEEILELSKKRTEQARKTGKVHTKLLKFMIRGFESFTYRNWGTLHSIDKNLGNFFNHWANAEKQRVDREIDEKYKDRATNDEQWKKWRAARRASRKDNASLYKLQWKGFKLYEFWWEKILMKMESVRYWTRMTGKILTTPFWLPVKIFKGMHKTLEWLADRSQLALRALLFVNRASQKIKDFLSPKNLFRVMKGAVMAGVSGITKVFGMFKLMFAPMALKLGGLAVGGIALLDFLQNAKGEDIVPYIWKRFVGLIGSAFDSMGIAKKEDTEKWVNDLVANSVTAIRESIKATMSSGIQLLSFGTIDDKQANIWSEMAMTFVGDSVGAVFAGVENAVNEIGRSIEKTVAEIGKVWSDPDASVMEKLFVSIGAVFHNISEGVVNAVKGYAKPIWDRMKEIFTVEYWTNLFKDAENVEDGEEFQKSTKWFGEQMDSLKSRFIKKIETSWTSISSWWDKLDIVKSIQDSLSEGLTSLSEKAGAYWTNLFKDAENVEDGEEFQKSTKWFGADSTIVKLTDKIKEFFSEDSPVLSALKTLKEKFDEITISIRKWLSDLPIVGRMFKDEEEKKPQPKEEKKPQPKEEKKPQPKEEKVSFWDRMKSSVGMGTASLTSTMDVNRITDSMSKASDLAKKAAEKVSTEASASLDAVNRSIETRAKAAAQTFSGISADMARGQVKFFDAQIERLSRQRDAMVANASRVVYSDAQKTAVNQGIRAVDVKVAELEAQKRAALAKAVSESRSVEKTATRSLMASERQRREKEIERRHQLATALTSNTSSSNRSHTVINNNVQNVVQGTNHQATGTPGNVMNW